MVRFYDPSRTDPSLIFIRGVQNLFGSSENKLSEDELRGAIKNIFRDHSYKKMFQDYITHQTDFPDVIIRSDCPTKRSIISPYMDFKYYKSYYDSTKNQICICSNFVNDMLDLKENLDRELVLAYDHNIRKKDLTDNEMFSCSQIRACRKQYENFNQVNEDLRKNLTFTCAKYLLKVIILEIS
jgi:hypothetical protein